MTLLPALLFAALTPLTSRRGAVDRMQYLMGTVCEVAVDASADPGDVDRAFAEAKRIETMLSTWTEASELSRVNRGEAEPSPELRGLLATADGWAARTSHAFDPHVRDLIDLWEIRGGGAVPSADALGRAMRQRPARGYEEGAFGKGYAIDRMLSVVAAPEVMVNFGGQVAVRGSMRVWIADPRDRSKPVVALTLSNASLSTSSGSEKTFESAGRRFSHIVDPRSGEALPPRGSVSVIAHDALTADILSTALYVMGEDEGLRWADANGVAAIFIDTADRVRVSAATKESVGAIDVLDAHFELKDSR